MRASRIRRLLGLLLVVVLVTAACGAEDDTAAEEAAAAQAQAQAQAEADAAAAQAEAAAAQQEADAAAAALAQAQSDLEAAEAAAAEAMEGDEAAQAELAAALAEAEAALDEAEMAAEEAMKAAEAAEAEAAAATTTTAPAMQEPELIEVVVSEDSDIYNFDPKNSAGGEFDAPVFTTIYETLAWTSPSGDVLPRLATDWTISEDKMTYTFNLREGVKFHNGADFTAHDVVYSVNRAVSQGIPMVQQRAQNLESVTAVDDYTVVYQLKQPSTAFLLNIADTTGLGFSSILTSTAPAHGTTPVGTGPFTFVSYVPGSELVLDVNRDYWDPSVLPSYDRIRVRIIKEDASMVAALNSKEVALIHPTATATARGLRDNPDFTIIDTASRTFWIHASRVGATRDEAVVKALWLSMDRQALADIAFLGEAFPWSTSHPSVAYGLGPDDLPNYQRDVEEAKRILAEAGYSDGVELVFTYPTRVPYEDVFFEVLQASWAEAGITVNLNPVEQAVWIPKLINADYDLSATDQGWYSNPYRYVLPRTGWQAPPEEILPELIPELDALAAASQDERPEIFQRIQILEAENVYPYTGTVYANASHVYHNELLSNADMGTYITGDKRVLYLSLVPAG
ncbi:MAG: ABC transporter substrate-binding protein [Acidimicrobiia bacterium]|nr:ABC transporter substrate-binding protein [Acidimicrobiia bacterium]MYB44475.1 ABC transporter substrate-binding protein [Acidimicrobiia bacterium]MYC86233.1 ABC transporter substrate-binding protein [Acidimicrobiia bacterium]